MESRHRAVVPGLVHLRPAMRLDARGDPPRDRKLGMDGGDLLLHADPGLSRKPSHLSDRDCARRGLVSRLRHRRPASIYNRSDPITPWSPQWISPGCQRRDPNPFRKLSMASVILDSISLSTPDGRPLFDRLTLALGRER